MRQPSDDSRNNVFEVRTREPAPGAHGVVDAERSRLDPTDATHTGPSPPTPVRALPDRRGREPKGEMVAVISGGDALRNSAGQENGRAVAAGLAALGCRPVTVAATPRLATALADSGVRTAVPAVLDQRLLDGTLPEICNELEVICVGASGSALRACADKAVAHARLKSLGLAVPEQYLFTKSAEVAVGLGALLPTVVARLGDEVYVKPRYGHGGAGVKKIRGWEAAAAAIVNAFSHGESVVLERAVTGEEVTVLMTGDAAEPMAVGIATVTYDSDDTIAASWARRYAPATGLDDSARRAAVRAARGAGRALDLDGLFTVDIVLDEATTAWVIDVDGMLDWRKDGALAACVASSDVTEPQLLASLLRDAGAAMRKVA
jgi:D-alanine-D-alanine ligase